MVLISDFPTLLEYDLESRTLTCNRWYSHFATLRSSLSFTIGSRGDKLCDKILLKKQHASLASCSSSTPVDTFIPYFPVCFIWFIYMCVVRHLLACTVELSAISPHESASPRWASCRSWCRRSSPRRRRRRTCSGGPSLCGSLRGASAAGWWAPRPRGPSGSLSQGTCQPAGSTWHSPWPVHTGQGTDYTGAHSYSTRSNASSSPIRVVRQLL